MYQDYYRLSRRPFAATPNPADLARLPRFDAAVGELARCVRHATGPAVLSAPPGAGKTMALVALADHLAGGHHPVLLTGGGFSDRTDLLQTVLFELARPFRERTVHELRLDLTRTARALAADRKTGPVVLLIDDAHTLDAELLDELRRAAADLADGTAPVRVVLAGRPELEDTLASPACAALAERVAAHATLPPLGVEETAEFLAVRVGLAGGDAETVFAHDALARIARLAGGDPRAALRLADQTLLRGCATGERPVSADTVDAAVHDLRGLPLNWNLRLSDLEGAADDGADETHTPDRSGERSAPSDLPADPVAESPAAAPSTGAAVYEVGAAVFGEPGEPGSDVTPPAGPATATAAAPDDEPTGTAGCDDEVESVSDRYARLDARRPQPREEPADEPAADSPLVTLAKVAPAVSAELRPRPERATAPPAGPTRWIEERVEQPL